MTKLELEAKIEEIRKYKAMVEEASNIQKALESEVIAYMNENNKKSIRSIGKQL